MPVELSKYKQLTGHFARFLVVGAISTAIEIAVFNACLYGLNMSIIWAKAVASVVALVNAYLGNRHWTFRHRDRRGRVDELVRFVVVNLFCTVLGILMVWAGVYLAGLVLGRTIGPAGTNMINLVSIILVVLVRFWLYNTTVFRVESDTSSEDVSAPDKAKAEQLVRLGLSTQWVRCAILLVVSFCFQLVYGISNSPLTKFEGYDSSVFKLVGLGMRNGQVPYVGIWDHKGPSLYLVEWLGQTIHQGRFGIFLVLTVLLFGSLLCLDSIASRFLPVSGRIIVILAILGFMALTLEGGNLTEDISLVFSAFVLMTLTKEWVPNTDSETKLRPYLFFLSGCALAFVALARVNNALPAAAIFLAYFLIVVVRRKPFVRNFVISLAGFLAMIFAFVLASLVMGNLREMYEAFIVFNQKYAVSSGETYSSLIGTSFFRWAVVVLFIIFVSGIFYRVRTGKNEYLVWSVASSGFSTVALFLSTTGYFHYLIILVPGLALALALIFYSLEGTRGKVVQCLVAVASIYLLIFAPLTVFKVNEKAEAEYSEQAKLVVLKVPKDERSTIYTWGIGPQFNILRNLLPVQRFYVHQEHLAAVDPGILDESVEFLETDKPKWVVTSNGVKSTTVHPPRSPEIVRILNEDYTVVYKNNDFVLHRLILND